MDVAKFYEDCISRQKKIIASAPTEEARISSENKLSELKAMYQKYLAEEMDDGK